MSSPTTLSPQTSPVSPATTAEYPDYIAPWDENLEARLQYNQKQLEASQKRWSQGQELWLDEVRTLSPYHLGAKHLNTSITDWLLTRLSVLPP